MEGISSKQVIAAAEKVIGKKLDYTIAKRLAGDPAILIASSQKAKDELGWEPEQPALEEMIADAWSFLTSGKS